MNRNVSAKAIDLEKQIDTLEKEKEYWEVATKINSVHLETKDGYPQMNKTYISFKVMKALAVATIEEKLTKLKKEYEIL
jgi:hypothetical protein